jgi:hypothetical protein
MKKNFFQLVNLLRYNKITSFLMGLIISYAALYMCVNQERRLYKEQSNCLKILTVKQKSEWKGQPSFIVNREGKEFEYIQYWNYETNFLNFKPGDKICKMKNSFHFLRIDNQGSIDTVSYDAEPSWIFKLLGFDVEPFNGDDLECSCLQK